MSAEPIGPTAGESPRGASAAASQSSPPSPRRAWPLRRDDASRLVGLYLVLTAVGVGVGLLLTRSFRDSTVTRTDRPSPSGSPATAPGR